MTIDTPRSPDSDPAREGEPRSEEPRSPDDGWVEPLVEWFGAHQRPLPWRAAYDPYAVWVSEIMLQQTQVATAVPFFERFMARFPSLADLAAAPEEEVLGIWAGLGYYSRARNLRRGAQEIVARFAGRLPDGVEDLLSVNGIGRYTAGAIASIAYNRPAPILDGNVMRVLCRLYSLHGDPRSAPLNGRLWRIAERLIPEGGARAFNQALMELGATVCTPRDPRCGRCPVSGWCRSYESGDPERLPETPPRPRAEKVRMACAVIVRPDDRVLLVRPAAEGRWGGLWQLPNGTVEPAQGYSDRARTLLDEMKIPSDGLTPLLEVRHGITRFSITLAAFEFRLGRPVDARGGVPWRWVDRAELRRLPLPAPHRRVADAWMAGTRSELLPGRQLELPAGSFGDDEG